MPTPSPTAAPDASTAVPPEFLRRVVTEVEAGLPNHKKRMHEAEKNLDIYRGDFERYPVTVGGERAEHARYSLVMQRVINTLTGLLYKSGPKRRLGDNDAATEWLDGVYRANHVDAMFQHADRMSGVSDVAAFQVLPSPDPKRPVRVFLWDASQFVCWSDPDDPCRPLVVATVDRYNEQRRLRLWTDAQVIEYRTTETRVEQTTGGTAYHHVRTAANDLGFLPFSFVHWVAPLTDFWSPGPGDYLREVNLGMNYGLTTNFSAVGYNLQPIVKVRNAPINWRVPSAKPGSVWYMTGPADAGGESMGDMDADYLQADSSFVAASWDDFQAYLDHVLEMNGVPPATVRMVQDSARSGVSIAAEQVPLVDWAESRQRPFASYEDALASLVLQVGARHLGAQEDAALLATSADLEAAAADPNLTLRWPKLYPQLPGPEADAADKAALDLRITSRTLILMRRENLTREEAEEALEDIAEDLKREQQLFAALDPQDAGEDGKPPRKYALKVEDVPPKAETKEPDEQQDSDPAE